jgi:hypothetical protein
MTNSKVPQWQSAIFGDRDDRPRLVLPEDELDQLGRADTELAEPIAEAKPFDVPRIPRPARAYSALPSRSIMAQRRSRPNSQRPEACPGIPEWHAMTPAERQAAWPQLIAWVTWLHDRYELSIETRLPRCWAQHPGLIEELLALKVWREEIYNAKGPSGQAARYWHNELRQLITTAVTFYARNCRSGHKGDGVVLASTTPEIQSAWAVGDPLAGIPAPLLQAEQRETMTDSDVFLTAATMKSHLADGRATPLSRAVEDFVSFNGFWWKTTTDGWAKITDPLVSSSVELRQSQLAESDARISALAVRSNRPAES